MTATNHILKNSESRILWVLFGALFTYLALRSIYTPILHDEIATFYYYIQTGFFFPPEAHWDANNHILNSLLSHWSFKVFGSEPWALRLPNVLSFPIFYWFSWKLLRAVEHIGLKWSSFLALVMCHYMFEYFGETRGYGLSMAFLIVGLYFAITSFKTSKFQFSLAAMLSLFLAVAANLTIVYIYLMVLTILVVGIMVQKESALRKILQSGALVLLSGAIVAPLIHFSLELKARGALYYGGKSSFIQYTLSTLSDLILGSKHPAVLGLIIMMSILLLIFFIVQLKDNFKNLFGVILEEKLFFSTLFFGSLTAIFATRYLLDVNFPEDRTALYLYPLLILALANAAEVTPWKSDYVQPIAGLLMAYVPIFFVFKIDLSQASFSMEERAPQEFFNRIERESQGMKFKPTVGGYTTQNLCWYFMNYQRGGQQNSMLFSSYPDTLCDYQILNIKTKLPQHFKDNYQRLSNKPINELHLYKRNAALKRNLIVEKTNITNWTHQKVEFWNLLELPVEDNLRNKPLLLEVSGIFHAPNSPFYGKLIISQKDKDWNELSQEGFTFNWLRYDWKDEKPFNQVLVLPNLDAKAQHIQIFIWNIQDKPYLVRDLNLSLFGLE